MARSISPGPYQATSSLRVSSRSGPSTYLRAERVASYLEAMRARRSELNGRRPLVYLARPPQHAAQPWFACTRDQLARELPGADIVVFEDVFGAEGRYPAGWDRFADQLGGLVVARPITGEVGPGILRELRNAVGRRLPVLVAGPVVVAGRKKPVGALAALVDCRLTSLPLQRQTPWRRVHLDLPSQLGTRLRPVTLLASLAVMGGAR